MGKTRRDGIRYSQIRGIFDQEPVAKMVDSKKLRWFGLLIRMDSNRKPRQVWETKLNKQGPRKNKDRMGTTYAEADEEKREDLAGDY